LKDERRSSLFSRVIRDRGEEGGVGRKIETIMPTNASTRAKREGGTKILSLPPWGRGKRGVGFFTESLPEKEEGEEGDG